MNISVSIMYICSINYSNTSRRDLYWIALFIQKSITKIGFESIKNKNIEIINSCNTKRKEFELGGNSCNINEIKAFD